MSKTQPPIALLVFGRSVRRRRLSMGLSQEEFASRVGLHRTYIGGIERGERNLSILKVIEIANALQVRPEDLVVDIQPAMSIQTGNMQQNLSNAVLK